MARQEFVGLRMSAEERQALEKAAKRLGVTMTEAARAAIATMAERVEKSGAKGAGQEAEFIAAQPEFGRYTLRVISGNLSYSEAIAKAGRDIAIRLKAEEEERRKARESNPWLALFGQE